MQLNWSELVDKHSKTHLPVEFRSSSSTRRQRRAQINDERVSVIVNKVPLRNWERAKRNHEERFNKLIKFNQRRWLGFARREMKCRKKVRREEKRPKNGWKTVTSFAAMRGRRKKKRRRRKNCANNSLVYVQSREATVFLLPTAFTRLLLAFSLATASVWTNNVSFSFSFLFCDNFKQGAGRRKLLFDNWR